MVRQGRQTHAEFNIMNNKPQITTGVSFDEVLELIGNARKRAYQAVNTTLIDLYWQVGAYISVKDETAEWGDGVVKQLAAHIARSQPGLKGFTLSNLFRMRQFYETYRHDEKVVALPRQLSWTQNLIISSLYSARTNVKKSVNSILKWRFRKNGVRGSLNASLKTPFLSALS